MKMEDYNKYTLTQSTWEFEIDEMKFSCEEITTEEELNYFNYYIDPNGKQNVAKLRMVQCLKLKKTPFTEDWVGMVFAKFYPEEKVITKVWADMTLTNRLLFLLKLKSEFFGDIAVEVGKHYIEKEESLKK